MNDQTSANGIASYDNVFIGHSAGGGTWGNTGTTTANVAVGNSAMGGACDAAENNTAVGHQALMSLTQGDQNVAIGGVALKDVNTGEENIAIGYGAGENLTNNGKNVLIGRNAGANLSAGIDGTVAIGHLALDGAVSAGHYTVAIGQNALGAVTSGDRNIGVGYSAGLLITSSDDMTCIGYEAGKDADSAGSTPFGCTYVGSRAGENKDDGTKNTAVGHYALQGTAANGQTANNNVAIGETAGAGVTTGDNNVFIGQAAGYVTQITADSDGCIIIGAGARQSGTAVDNEIIFGNDAAGQGTNTVLLGNGSVDGTNGLFCADTGIATPSDKRIKDNIKDNSTGLDYINKLRTVTYQKRHPADYPEELQGAFGDAKKPEDWVAKTEVGLISQEVKAVMDEMELDIQGHHTNPQGLETVKYVSFIIPLVKAVQELSEKVKALEDA